MNKHFILFILFLCGMSNPCAADNLDIINKVQKSNSYIYGDMTANTKEEAVAVAYNILVENIQAWAVSHSKKEVHKVVATDIRKLIDTIYTKRANMIRAFLYVRKHDLIPIYNGEGLVVVDADADDEPAPLTDTEKKPEVKAERSESVENTEKTETTEHPDTPKPVETSELPFPSQLLKLRSFFDLKKNIEPLKANGTIAEYGKYDPDEDLADCYLIIYDPAANIRAILGKADDDENRENLKTKAKESLENYRGCGAIWIRMGQRNQSEETEA